MAFRLYKEGQGTKARGALALTVGVLGILAAMRLYEAMEGGTLEQRSVLNIPFFNWAVNWGSILAGLLMCGFVMVGIWLYNHPRLSDFLIDTEAELRNKVTWPTRKETVNNSYVVVVTCLLLGIWIMMSDYVLQSLKQWLYT